MTCCCFVFVLFLKTRLLLVFDKLPCSLGQVASSFWRLSFLLGNTRELDEGNPLESDPLRSHIAVFYQHVLCAQLRWVAATFTSWSSLSRLRNPRHFIWPRVKAVFLPVLLKMPFSRAFSDLKARNLPAPLPQQFLKCVKHKYRAAFAWGGGSAGRGLWVRSGPAPVSVSFIVVSFTYGKIGWFQEYNSVTSDKCTVM